MSRKALYIIIAVLAVILVAGAVMVFVLPGMTQKNPPAAQLPETTVQTDEAETAGAVTEEPASQETTGEQVTETPEETEPTTGEIVVVTEPSEEATEEGPLIPTSNPNVTVPKDDGTVTYLDYISMSGDEQAAFINTFDSYEAFFTWFNAAKEEYEDGMIELDGSTPVDLGGIIGG